MQPPELVQAFFLLRSSDVIDGLAPVRHGAPEITHAQPSRRVHERSLRRCEGLWVRLAGHDQHPHGRTRDLALGQGLPRRRHLLEGPRRSHLLAGGGPGHPEALGEPRCERQVPVPAVGTSSLDLDQSPEALRMEDIGRPLQLGEVGFEPVVVDPGQVLSPQLIKRRPYRAHDQILSNMRSICSDARHTEGKFVDVFRLG